MKGTKDWEKSEDCPLEYFLDCSKEESRSKMLSQAKKPSKDKKPKITVKRKTRVETPTSTLTEEERLALEVHEQERRGIAEAVVE